MEADHNPPIVARDFRTLFLLITSQIFSRIWSDPDQAPKRKLFKTLMVRRILKKKLIVKKKKTDDEKYEKISQHADIEDLCLIFDQK